MSRQQKWRLSERESDVLLMVALGYRDRLIADYLKLSVQSVENHRLDLCKKLGVVDVGNLDAMIAAALFRSEEPESDMADVDELEPPEVWDRRSTAALSQRKALHDP